MTSIPSDVSGFYVGEQYDIPWQSEDFGSRAETQTWKLSLIQPFVSEGKLLEVGPATGEFATVARGAGFDVTLIEMDADCCRFLRDRLGHRVIESGDPASVVPSETLDVVCIWQAIEHIPNYWELVRVAAERLRRGGALVLSTPNPDSLQAQLLGSRWPHLDAPRHLYLIPPKWFRRTSASFGLQVKILTTRDEGSIGLNYYGWYLLVRNLLAERISQSRIGALAGRLTRFFRRFEHREGQGCSYVVILTKV